ncbi:T9SS type A sorting domain-containing protein [bacterium SCSIO 12741]|nr:T9SS type A sorting domain-containing protein [bacterium SCSIO 12741]
MASKKNSRRKFLKNTTLGALSLGVLPLVSKDAMATGNITDACDPTTLDYYGEGPFYTANPPQIQGGKLADSSEPGERLIISGRVTNLDCSQVIPDTIIDVWHADDAGAYDNVGYKLRGQTKSNFNGFFQFETIMPGKYLNGAQYRPAHIHFKITPPGGTTLTTQLYFLGDTDIPGDAAASISSGQFDATDRTISVHKNGQGVWEGSWDVIVDGQGVSTGLNEAHVDKGMIYRVSPNPFTDRVEIFYGVFRPAQVKISVFDMQGNEVAHLSEENLNAEKYTAEWRPEADLPKGYYFISLKVNDQQVHYQKVLRN